MHEALLIAFFLIGGVFYDICVGRGWRRSLLIAALLGGFAYLSRLDTAPNSDTPLVNGGRVHGARAAALVEEGALLLDVRTAAEFAAGHLDGALNIPVQALKARLAEVPKDRAVVVYCKSGARSAHAARLLLDAGHPRLYDLGPMSAYGD